MAAQKKKAAVNPHHLTAKQLAADRANLKKARAAQASRKRTPKQVQASRQNLVKARAAQKSRRAGKKFVTKKQAQAPAPASLEQASGGRSHDPTCTALPEASLHSLPVCAAVAIAASCEYQTGAFVEPAEIWRLYKLAGAATLGGVIEAAAATGMAGYRIASWQPWDPDVMLDGLVYGVAIEEGYHAVLTVPGGMLSWDTIVPRRGDPAEAWIIEWALS